jgi:flap endonuclease-1
MGIRGLNTCITRTTPGSIKSVRWADFMDSVIGIDITCFLYRAISSHINPVDVIAEQIVKFKSLKIKPIYVFDGKAPSEKDSVVIKRRNERADALELCSKLKESLKNESDVEIIKELQRKINEIEEKNPVLTYEIKDEIKRFLYITGTTFVTASGEADSLLAYMFKRDIIDAVISLDLDFIARGALLLVPKNIHVSPGETWNQYDPILIRNGLRLSETRFLDLCVLIGSDYTPELAIVPWKTALKSLLSNESITDIWSRHTFCNWRKTDTNIMLINDVIKLNKAKVILSGENDNAENLLDSEQWQRCFVSAAAEPEGLVKLKKTYAHWDSSWWAALSG